MAADTHDGGIRLNRRSATPGHAAPCGPQRHDEEAKLHLFAMQLSYFLYIAENERSIPPDPELFRA
jgi:type IV secretory pathway TrbF-like protein